MVNLIFLFIVSLILFFLGGWLIPITDPTESVYALTAKEMLEAGDWFSPRIYGDYWFDKPIMFYWELLIAYKIFGVNEFASRFFPALFATLGLFLTYLFGAKVYDKKVGFAAAVMLATSLEYWYLSHAVITDMTLLVMFSITLGLPRRQAAILFDSVRGVGRSGLDERSHRIFFTWTYNFNLPSVAGRLATLERTFPRETFCDIRGDNRDMVFANDISARRGVH